MGAFPVLDLAGDPRFGVLAFWAALETLRFGVLAFWRDRPKRVVGDELLTVSYELRCVALITSGHCLCYSNLHLEFGLAGFENRSIESFPGEFCVLG